ncbi:MAG: AIPR family protein [Deferribacteres bacterium]|nr:AIPR family protein [Deferribacteres bacterium]
MLENNELFRFYSNLQEEIKYSLLAEEEGANPEQIFTDIALTMLADAGETENSRTCYDEKLSKRGVEHKVNGYALHENYETLDLFITIYNAEPELTSIAKTDVDKALTKLSKFFLNSVNKSYVNEIEESSEIFDLANTLSNIPDVKRNLVRVNAFLLTNFDFMADFKSSQMVAGYPVIYRIIDINYLYNLSEKSRIPIEIDFQELGTVPCISKETGSEGYQSYLAIIPGLILAYIYEIYGLRLLEQNVRSFLQFTGKINRGIKNTILTEPHMFLAFNNGIAATAEEVRLIDMPGGGKAISFIKDFQIVNGGQTTAAIYHTWKNSGAKIADIYVQMKLTTIENPDKFADTVARIAEYANTQNRISLSDLSSNRESLILFEQLSRNIWAPPIAGESIQTRWFFERARGQYKNERNRQGFTPSRRKAFDLRNPRNQMFNKEQLAKYINSYQEISKNNMLLVGPHHVVRGSQKNFAQFLHYNLPAKPNELYFQETVAKAIIFKTCEKVYGISPNSIGDMRYITVPYSIAWLTQFVSARLDLYYIWKKQSLSNDFKKLLYSLMLQIDGFIRHHAPGSLYGEWAKKEDCWLAAKGQHFKVDLTLIREYMVIENNRFNESDDSSRAELSAKEMKNKKIEEVGADKWRTIFLWYKNRKSTSLYFADLAYNISRKLRNSVSLSEKEIDDGTIILEDVARSSSLLQDRIKPLYSEHK